MAGVPIAVAFGGLTMTVSITPSELALHRRQPDDGGHVPRDHEHRHDLVRLAVGQQYRIKAGGTFTLTYSVAPTLVFVGD